MKLLMTAVMTLFLFAAGTAYAGEGRYQAYWNGKFYMIIDTDEGHLWDYWGDTIQYNGRIIGDEFVSPKEATIWQQSMGKWKKK